MNLKNWSHIAPEPFLLKGVPGFAGISGGRTSAMMAALLDPGITLSFQNTGREHPGTYDFLRDLERGLGRKIVWLELRPPKHKGAPPKDFLIDVVDYKTADRTGKPFRDMLRSLAEYRAAVKGLGPVAPWAQSRICTAYLKARTFGRYIKALGVDEHDMFIGLRADEPARVHRLNALDTQKVTFRTPLAQSGITKSDVYKFWAEQTFDLQIRDYQGNCTGCFLKDQSDLARSMQEPESDHTWWEEIERDFPGFGGRDFRGYKVLKDEGPIRLKIEAALRAGLTPENDGSMEPRRFKNVVNQEKRRIANEIPTFSCQCEAATSFTDVDEEAEEHLILNLPEVDK